MKARRKVVPGIGPKRTPTVRTIRPAIRSPQGSGGRPAAGPSRAADASPAASTDAIGGRPVDLAVDLGRGLVLANPVLAASGSMGYGVEVADAVDLGRLGGLVTRGTTLKPRAGHPAPRTADIPAGLLLGIGLQNPGIESVLERYAPTWARWSTPVIVNLCGESAGDIADMARRLEGVPGIAAVELNLSCANGSRGAFGLDEGAAGSLVTAVRRATDLPLIAKLTAAASDVRAIARAVEDAGADAISAINTMPGLALSPDRSGPALASGYGGVCGPALKPHGLRVVWEVAQVVDDPGHRHRRGERHRRRARLPRRGGVRGRRRRRRARGPDAPGAPRGRARGRLPGARARLRVRARGHGPAAEAVPAVDARRGVRPMSPLLIGWLFVINLATAAAYASDKLAARRGDRRIRERTLWLLCLAGGFVGAWIVFFGMRHKTRKQSFWIVQSIATVAWLAIIVVVLTG